MGRALHRLSAKTLEKAIPPGYHCDGEGLYLQVSPTQSQSWIFRYKRQGRSREMGLGSARDVSLAQARAKASEARRQLTEGGRPPRGTRGPQERGAAAQGGHDRLRRVREDALPTARPARSSHQLSAGRPAAAPRAHIN